MKDPDREVTWADGMDGELHTWSWTPDGLTAIGEPVASPSASNLISLAFLGEVLRRSAWFWCATGLLGLLIGAVLYVQYPPAQHARTSVLLVDSPNQDPAVEVLTDQSMAESEPVAARVVKELGLQQSVGSLQAAYTVTPVTNTVLRFDVGAPSGADATRRAAALANSYLQYRAKYAQAQAQELTAQLEQQYNEAEQHLKSIDAQLAQLPPTQLTTAQKIQLDKLETQQGDQKQIMQYATGTIAATKAETAAMISGSYVLNPPTVVAYSHVKGASLYLAGGLFGGLAVGMAIMIVTAMLSDRLRRRDDVAAALGAPVRLSVGSPRVPPWRAAQRDTDIKRVTGYLQGAVPGSSHGPVSLAVVAVDDARLVAPSVLALAVSRARVGQRVVLADLSAGDCLARLLGVSGPGVHEVERDGAALVVAVPGRDEIAPVGPVPASNNATLWAQPDEELAAAYSAGDLLVTLATLDPAVGGNHLATWAAEAIAVVTAGRSSAERVHSAGEMIRLAGVRLDSAILIGADRSDQSLGFVDQPHPLAGFSQAGKAEPGGDGVPA